MHGKIYNNITELIGRTPLVRLNRIVPAGAAEVAAKLEPVRVRSNLASKIAIPQTTPIMCIHQSPNPTIAPAWSRLAKIRNAPGATTKLRNTSLPSHKLKPRNSIVRSKIDMGSLYKNDPNEPK